MNIYFYNTLTKKKELFKQNNTELVKMYVCGPTVYDHPHIGNARSCVVFDQIWRLLKWKYSASKVKYVRNITDIDDKIISRAKKEKIKIKDLITKTIKAYYEDIDYLYCDRPNVEPKATEHLQDMFEMIQDLIDNGCAYKSEGHVYFDVNKAKNYTKLSGRDLNSLIDEVRIEKSPGKKNSADFVLWKPAKLDEDCSYESPFGYGRPGWHIECSAMSKKHLGENFDIHGGGIDIIFPHHTNEIAQSTCANKGSTYANYWIHNGLLTVNNEKMSKSLGNFITVRELIDKKISGEVIRLFLLSVHYRKPLDYNEKALDDAKKTLDYWYRAIDKINQKEKDIIDNEEIFDKSSTLRGAKVNQEKIDSDIDEKFMSAICDDLNTSLAISQMNDLTKEINSTTELSKKEKLIMSLYKCGKFLGLFNISTDQWLKGYLHNNSNEVRIDTFIETESKLSTNDVKMVNKIEDLIISRGEARKSKDWGLADKLRKDLENLDVVIEDHPDGSSSWRKK